MRGSKPRKALILRRQTDVSDPGPPKAASRNGRLGLGERLLRGSRPPTACRNGRRWRSKREAHSLRRPWEVSRRPGSWKEARSLQRRWPRPGGRWLPTCHLVFLTRLPEGASAMHPSRAAAAAATGPKTAVTGCDCCRLRKEKQRQQPLVRRRLGFRLRV